MTFIESVKGSVSAAVESISDAAQNLVEKNRLNAQLNRLRLIMKNESELINRAYITLGKSQYAQLTGIDCGPVDVDAVCQMIEKSKDRIKKAQLRYRQLIENHNDEVIQEIDRSELEDITVACSNEGDYESSPFEKTEDEPHDDKSQEQVQKISDILKERSNRIHQSEANEGESQEKVNTEIAPESDAF